MKNPPTPRAGQAQHTQRPELSFDGCGINGPDQYRSRIATFTDKRGPEAMKYGPLFAAAPTLETALQASNRMLIMVGGLLLDSQHMGKIRFVEEQIERNPAALALAERGEG